MLGRILTRSIATLANKMLWLLSNCSMDCRLGAAPRSSFRRFRARSGVASLSATHPRNELLSDADVAGCWLLVDACGSWEEMSVATTTARTGLMVRFDSRELSGVETKRSVAERGTKIASSPSR